MGDIGSHIENMISYVTGLEIDELNARLDSMVEGRKLDNNAVIMVNYKGDAWGHDNDFSFRVYGTKGSVSWRQEAPNYLKVVKSDGGVKATSRGRDEYYPHPGSYVRVPAGHPEGYFEAFANIYSTFIAALKTKKAGGKLSQEQLDFLKPIDGANGVRFIEKCVESLDTGGQSTWKDITGLISHTREKSNNRKRVLHT